MAKMPDLGQQIGPLPLGAWIAVVGGGLAIAYTSRSRGGVVTEAGIVTSADPNVNGAGAQFENLSPVNVGSVQITDNESWGVAAINALLSENYDPSLVDNAVRKYLAGAALTVSETAVIAAALRRYGSPPVPLPPGPDTINPSNGMVSISADELQRIQNQVATEHSAYVYTAEVLNRQTTGQSANSQVPIPKDARTYTVGMDGETLGSIANHFYGMGAMTWAKLYAANVDRIGLRNPTATLPIGLTLIIPA